MSDYTKWCEEARALLKLARPAGTDRRKALIKALEGRHADLKARLAALERMRKSEPTLVAEDRITAFAHDLQIAGSQINIENYLNASESLGTLEAELKALVDASKAAARGVVETLARASEQERDEIKGGMRTALGGAAGAPLTGDALAQLRRLADQEFKRDAQQAELLRQAGAMALGLPPPPARTAFADNATPSAAVWTEAVCEAAFKAHSWFDFKAFRKQGAAAVFKVPGLDAANCQVSDDVMWRLYQFRRHVVDGLVAQMNARWPGRLLFSSNGSEDIESDLDITIASPHGGEDVEAMSFFNQAVAARFGRPPGRVFDTNLYARDYNAIKADNLSKAREGEAPKDHAIAEPGGAMAAMANIDQDVATLMKQRRFMDADAFTAMWKGLQASMPEGDRKAIAQRFEEAEDVYLLTAMDKVAAIERQVEAAIDTFDGPACEAAYGRERLDEKLAAHKDFRAMQARVAYLREQHAKAEAGSKQTQLLMDFQRLQDDYLDLMEHAFEDETMAATDAIYAKRMTALRADQAFIEAQEKALAESEPSDAELKQMQDALASAKARAKQAQFTNIVFANEAYVSQGAITHVVSGKQAGDASVLAAITPADLMQSSNEQLADFLKDMKHMEHAVPAEGSGAQQRQAIGEAFVHASKYLARMLEAVAMLEGKYEAQLGNGNDKEKEQLAALKAPYPIVSDAARTRGEIKTAKDLQLAVEGHLLKLRKSSTIPGDVKAEMAVAESLELFGCGDIPSLRAKIQAFCTEFNRRVRNLDDFRNSQTADATTQRQYFEPGYQPPPPKSP